MLKDFIPCCIPQSHPLPRTPAKPHRSTATATFCLHSTANQLPQSEVAEFHHMQNLSTELIALNEQICRLRPVEPDATGWTAQEKKRVLQSIRKSRAK